MMCWFQNWKPFFSITLSFGDIPKLNYFPPMHAFFQVEKKILFKTRFNHSKPYRTMHMQTWIPKKLEKKTCTQYYRVKLVKNWENSPLFSNLKNNFLFIEFSDDTQSAQTCTLQVPKVTTSCYLRNLSWRLLSSQNATPTPNSQTVTILP